MKTHPSNLFRPSIASVRDKVKKNEDNVSDSEEETVQEPPSKAEAEVVIDDDITFGLKKPVVQFSKGKQIM